MQAVVLVLLLGVSLCGVHGSEEQLTPDVLSMVKELQTTVQMLGEEGQIIWNKVQTLENLNQTLQTTVQSLQTKVQTLETQNQALRTKVQTLETQDQALRTKVQTLETRLAQQQNQQVAFFAGLYNSDQRGRYGPFDDTTTVKYKRVITNIGNGYNAATGMFTAPRKGLYVFHFTVFTDTSPNAYVQLIRNGFSLALVWDITKSDAIDSSTRIAVVTLEAGDRVYVQLVGGYDFDGVHGYYNSFSGFLLSPM